MKPTARLNRVLTVLMIALASASWCYSDARTLSREEYKELFDRLSKEGCHACVAEGYGWSESLSRCGGFSSSSCPGASAVSVDDGESKQKRRGSIVGDDEEDWENTEDADDDEDDWESEEPEWKNTPLTTSLWSAISSGDLIQLKDILETHSDAASARSEDGRGPLFWAYEYGRENMIDVLLSHGSDPNAKDSSGNAPAKLLNQAGASTSAPQDSNDIDDDLDYDPFDEVGDDNDDDSDLEGYATAGITSKSAKMSRSDYKVLFDELTEKGCKACTSAGYGWSAHLARCGGFSSSTCA